MKRVVLHWTAGADGVNSIEADAYHFIIGRDGAVTNGVFRPEDNRAPLRRGAYAAHTLNLNSDSIGVALDAMAGAKERPFDAGAFPITNRQLEAMAKLVATLCLKYQIPVTRQTVLTHAEVQPTLGIKQKNKWDIMWIPPMSRPGDPIDVGDDLRARITAAMQARMAAEVAPDVQSPAPERFSIAGFIAALLRAIPWR
jgi:N-acetyl-anhydromuramyl-L-alanine amidase AmpD